MSRIINLTPEMIEAAKAELGEQLAKGNFTDGKFQFTKTFEESGDKAVLHFTQTAWLKMTTVLKEFSKEVAWHGVAHRVDGDENAYIVSDIMVYPQTVGPATVDMDPVAYSKWIVDHDGDERFNAIRFQGHSHVNMPTSPSGTDMGHQEEILSQLGQDDFYIFVIYNKSLSHDIRIYDLKKNRMYGNADITVKIIWDFDLDGFLEESKAMVKERATYSNYSGSGSFTGNYGGYSERPVTPAGSDKAIVPAKNGGGATKPVTKPTAGGWSIVGPDGRDDDDSPYPSQK